MFGFVYNYVVYYLSRFFRIKHEPHPRLKHSYYVSYVFEGNTYTLLIKKRRGPRHICAIYGNETGEEPRDVYNHIRQFLGPNFDFHNIPYTPSCFKLDSITFCFDNGDTKTFSGNETISI
jgi:hypothetical protein